MEKGVGITGNHRRQGPLWRSIVDDFILYNQYIMLNSFPSMTGPHDLFVRLKSYHLLTWKNREGQ